MSKWTLVPAEPTDAMLRAYDVALKRHIDALPDEERKPGRRELIVNNKLKAILRYRAMLAAAPEPPPITTTLAQFDWRIFDPKSPPPASDTA